MALSKEQIISLLKEPKAKAQLVKALKHEQRVRFHAEEATDDSDISPYLKDYFEWVAKFLPSDKLEMFKKLMSAPVYTNELIKGIAEEYAKVYDSQNSSFTYEFSNPSDESDFRSYLREIDFWSNWKDESAEAMLKMINSILVVDMPKDPSIDIRPYYYFLPVENVHDIIVDRSGSILFLIARQAEDVYLVIDEESYRLFKKESNDTWIELLNAPHDLGYCPAAFFWKKSVKKSRPIVKRSPVTAALNNLDWLLWFEVARRCLETYATFPIYVTYKEKCTYYEEIDKVKIACNNGFLNLPTGSSACPACSKNRMIGPGTLFKVPMPSNKDQPNNIDAVKVIPAEEASLNYCKARSSELWEEIFYDCVGYGGDDMQSQAVNEKQVRAGFESKQNILVGLKENLEAGHKFLIETMARMRYGASFISCVINYGTDFYLKSGAEAVKEFKDAKDAGVPQYFITSKRDQIDSISTKGNETDAERLNILKHLEPWIDMSLKDVKDLGLDVSNREEFLLKADFSRLILKFESEYGSIVEFGSLIDFKTKIDRITKQLFEYVRESYQKIPEWAGA